MLTPRRDPEPGGPQGRRDGSRTGSDGPSDEERFLAARSGDREAQEDMVHRYLPRIFNLFVRCLGDRDVAADASQEVFLRVFRTSASFDATRSFRAWIFAIAWNLARDILRQRAVRRREGPIVAFGEEIPGREPGPERALEREERRAAVLEALDGLDPRQKALLVLREVEGLSHEELAALLGCRVGTVKSGLHRARLELKTVLVRLHPDLAHDV